ncbi:hypothetical protein [Duganella flavida]|uniref:hypothetical protein n=1 Tax=Duganella flavida TaxID=2692175 RepID=UPI002805A9F2|nr:hypothetical protein [Duganella flavida]
MKLLLDTHLLLWVAGHPEKLSVSARSLLNDSNNELLFSDASLWEMQSKEGSGVATSMLIRAFYVAPCWTMDMSSCQL